jgi:peptidoglycan-associated lipoprotein
MFSSCRSGDFLDENEANINSESLIHQKPAAESYQTLDNESQASAVNQTEIEVKDRVFFDYNSSDVNSDAKSVLTTQVEWLTSNPQINVIIEGHCDERGTREYNIALGEKRAESVKKHLISGGISSSRINVVSYGKERPAHLGSGETALSKNRRAVVVIDKE